MRIMKENHKNTVTFGDIPAGTVFKSKDETACKGEDGIICMKLEAEYEELPRNAVNLSSGSLYLYDEKEEVEILEDAVLTY